MKRFRALPRSGFTLVEVLLALSLTVVLLGAVSIALTPMARLSNAGQVEVEQARLAQAILRKMERDIRSVVFRPPQLAAASSSGQPPHRTNGKRSNRPGSRDNRDSRGNCRGRAAAWPAAVRSPQRQTSATARWPSTPARRTPRPTSACFGDSTTLIVHVSHPSREMNYEPLSTAMPPEAASSDLQSVSWFLAWRTEGGLQGAVGNVASGAAPAARAHPGCRAWRGSKEIASR